MSGEKVPLHAAKAPLPSPLNAVGPLPVVNTASSWPSPSRSAQAAQLAMVSPKTWSWRSNQRSASDHWQK
ncbi:MAG: hypothetical protein IPM35_18555 [Myxococcales bacterium]|nr:hypothetical protein [Myxococcales bacterium]